MAFFFILDLGWHIDYYAEIGNHFYKSKAKKESRGSSPKASKLFTKVKKNDFGIWGTLKNQKFPEEILKFQKSLGDSKKSKKKKKKTKRFQKIIKIFQKNPELSKRFKMNSKDS